MSLIKYKSTAAIIACSNGIDVKNEKIILELKDTLNKMGINIKLSNTIYRRNSIFNGSNKEKAQELMKFFEDDEVEVIFDISGGDLANGILEYLDFDIIKKNPKLFFGYSDLTVVINSLYKKAGIKSCLYQIRNIISDNKEIQCKRFKDTFIYGKNSSLLDFDYRWIQGYRMEGVVIGGNIRCLLKLAGTEYMPDFTDKIIFLESMSGDVGKMATYLTQYRQMGIFNKVKGIILGTYSEMEAKGYKPDIIELVTKTVDNPNIPIVKTQEIGHGNNSKCLIIGERIKLVKK